MYQDKIVLCGANSYEEKFYMNPDFDNLPQHIKDELKIMCVLYVHDVGGILTLVFEENGELEFEVTSAEGDPMFDDIGSQLKIKQLQREKQEFQQSNADCGSRSVSARGCNPPCAPNARRLG